MVGQYRLTDIQFKYDQNLVLDIPAAYFEAKKSYAILGENGSGKSTLFNLLALLQPVQEGYLTFFDTRVDNDNYKKIQQSIAYVQQKPYLFNFSVYENLELPLKLRKEPIEVRRQKTQHVIEQFALDDLIQRNAKHLSGGEMQKVALARALITNPEVLILDEPFTHLDAQTRKEFESYLIQLKKQQTCTIIFSLHDEFKAHLLADNVYRLSNGCLLDANIMNLFEGVFDEKDHCFDTGRIKIHLPESYEHGNYIAIDAKQIVLSREPIVSSMQNAFFGKISCLVEHQDQILITILGDEPFQCIITHQAFKELALHPGDSVWVNFKSSMIKTL